MVRMDELPEDLQKKIRDLYEAIKGMENRPEHFGLGPIYLVPEYYAVLLIKELINGIDSWKFLDRYEEVEALKDFLDKNNMNELLRDLLEIQYRLSKLPVEKPCYAQ